MAGSWPKGKCARLRSCPCWNCGADYHQFAHFRSVGTDMTESRYAEVAVQECQECHQLWLRYFVEYEAFSRSARWARGPIGRPEAETITPERAVSHLEQDSYVYEGSYFDGAFGWRDTPMRWGI